MERITINKHLLISLLFFCLSVSFAFLNLIDLSLMILIVACIFEVVFIKRQPLGYSSVTFIFIVFSIIYGLVGPVTQRWLGGINEIFGDVFDYPNYILAFSLSEVGLIIGFVFYLYRHKTTDIIELRVKNYNNKSIGFLRVISMALMVVGVSFQLINTFRAGGFDAIFMNKAYYQAAESALTLTLPAEMIVNLAFACFGLYIGLCKYYGKGIKTSTIMLNMIISIPYFIIILLLGQRGKILSILVILFLGLTILRPLRRLNKRMIILTAIAYLFLGFIYTNRSIVPLLLTDSEDFFYRVSTAERYEDGLNPGRNEFSCAFGNFNKVIIDDKYEFKYGRTYLDGLALIVPSFMYIGEKPRQITYEFRDTYFYSESKRSAIAGTAFSSILESYWNFGYVGILLTYAIYGFLVMCLDFSFSKRGVIMALFIVAVAGSLITFSRTQFGDVLTEVFYNGVLLVSLILIPYKKFIKKYEEKNDETI